MRHPGRELKDNPRFVVTNRKHSPRDLYEAIYCARGDIENRIKELHHGLEIECTNCNRFLANQLRGLLSAAAYVLYQELRLRADRTALRSAQVSTLREHLMKLGAWVESSVRRIVLHLPATCPASQRLADHRPQSWRCARIALSDSRRAASNAACLTQTERPSPKSTVERVPCSTIHRQRTDPRQNHRPASTSRPDIAKRARMTMKIRSFMHSA